MPTGLAVLGFGVMGSALVSGTLRASLIEPRDILIVDPDPSARARAERLGCRVAADPSYCVGVERIALAVKPQSFPEVAQSLGQLSAPTLVISVMAGVSMTRIAEALSPSVRTVRCMPNVAAQTGLAATVFACSTACTSEDRDFALRLLGALGIAVELPEHLFDAATAVSGSGPAYLFLLAEAMIESAVRLGLDQPTAERLVRQTLLGASTMLARSGTSPADHRAAVTSRGGTTSAALAVLDAHGFRPMINDALRAARDRGVDLAAAAAAHAPQGTGSTGVA
ncbi:MAG: pyrroline-5-carboxylate reductase [Phycisphaerales bacterium]|nr:pyrroline-5-carboxylate reductase [Phycisphaerales bacterium]